MSKRRCFVDDRDVRKTGDDGRKKGQHKQWLWCRYVFMKGQEDLSREKHIVQYATGIS